MSAKELQIQCSSLTAGYGMVPVLRDLSLEVKTGEVLGIIGPNGAGKSTLAKALANIIVARGELVLGSNALTTLASHHRARRGWITVTDDRALFRELTVEENLALGLGLAPARERSGLLEMVHERFPSIARRLDVQAGLLSGGEQQMLAIAKALCAKPKVLVLDEPSQGLAPSVIAVISDVLKQLRRDKLTVLLAEQNVDIVSQIADKFVVLVNGQIVDAGDVSEMNKADLTERFLA